ncbi:MAG: heavy-metal-associated domain-containing protein [Clostridia bacterium]|nr:heavy-metal-associated domain-containing protein [Oscillospiraceae bacterium]MBQ1955549.1 heavy-metal-associated domain-containing protein [Clostridia bacterium]
MKKTFNLEELDCAHCAAKMEDGIRKLDGVTSASVNFFAQKLILEAEDDRFDEILASAQKIISKIEPDCKIVR